MGSLFSLKGRVFTQFVEDKTDFEEKWCVRSAFARH
jgi:hypothetical protein